jgi:hypothetical protein
VGVGVGEAATVMLSEEEKKKPVESQARMMMLCFPAASERMAVSDALELWAFLTLSIYMIIAVIVCSLSRAAAEKVTGEVTVAPLAGEQMLTVLSTVAVHCADALATNAREKSIIVAAENVRSDMRGPVLEQQFEDLPVRLAQADFSGGSRRTPFTTLGRCVFLVEIGELLLDRGCISHCCLHREK